MGQVIFAINPGSTSTKLALFKARELVFEKSIAHNVEEIRKFKIAAHQLEYRYRIILDALEEANIDLHSVDAFVGRGGLLKPLRGGTYSVNEKMLEDLSESTYGDHASNLGAIIADRFGKEYDKPAYTVNPVVVDEFIDEARYTGLPIIKRISAFHALNQKAVAKKAAKDIGIDYEEGNFIVAHLGGGISVGAHKKGKVIDVNNALEEGPFSPERAGSLPTKQLVKLCFSGDYTKDEINKMLVGKGGFYAHTGTTDVKMIMEQAKTDESFRKVVNAFTYNLAKEICSLAACFSGDVDRIVITGGLAHSKEIVKAVEERVSFIAPLFVLPGEDELRALEEGVVNVLDGLEETKTYS